MQKHLKSALNYVSEARAVMESIENYEYSNCVNILHDQLVQLTSKRRKYSINTMLCGYSIFMQSANTYELTRNWRILILPHRTTLTNLARFQDINPNSNTSNMKYLKKVESNLKNVEKFVIIQMDEIYVDPQVSYWKRLEGFAENVDEVATTVLGVMVSSCFGNMKEIVNLIPMKDGTGTDLERYSLDVIKSLQTIGFVVMAIVTDNNRINQNLFSLLAPDGSFSFKNPDFLERVIRLIFDSIHIFKNFRNNWINLKDEDKSFFYPKFEDPSIIQLATFGDLRQLYHSEKLKMIKTAPKLNTKTLYPSSFDRQRVPLALNIIHPTTIAALRAKDCFETAEFLEVIRVWFTIMNNTTEKAEVGLGVEDWFERITSPDGFQVDFLKKFVVWLRRWKDLGPLLHTGGLTVDTFKAAISCTEGMIGLITDAFKSCPISSFSPGRIQTNALEKRFGCYRRLSGCHYNVSVRQIMESEKKLRIRNIISNIPDELQTRKYTEKKEKITDLSPYWDLLDSNYLENFKDYDHGSFMYVSGYTGYSILKHLKCYFCRDLIVQCKGDCNNNDYFDFLQRGGLIVPSENCILILIHMNAIFNELRKDLRMRRIFQFSEDPSNVLVLLTLEGIERNDRFIVDWNDTCLCGTSYNELFSPIMTIFANILLNNYRKKVNDINLQRKLNKRKAAKTEDTENNDKKKKIKLDEPKNRKGVIYEKAQ